MTRHYTKHLSVMVLHDIDGITFFNSVIIGTGHCNTFVSGYWLLKKKIIAIVNNSSRQ